MPNGNKRRMDIGSEARRRRTHAGIMGIGNCVLMLFFISIVLGTFQKYMTTYYFFLKFQESVKMERGKSIK